MTKRDFVMRISEMTRLPQTDVQAVVQMFLDHLAEAIAAGQHVEFRDFGMFDLKLRKARPGRNPKKPENVVMIPERKVVRFRSGKNLKELLKKA